MVISLEVIRVITAYEIIIVKSAQVCNKVRMSFGTRVALTGLGPTSLYRINAIKLSNIPNN